MYAVFIRNYNVDISFIDDMLERNSVSITLHDVDPTALRQLIEYTYSGEITITEDNVQVLYLDGIMAFNGLYVNEIDKFDLILYLKIMFKVLLPASSLLQIQSVREACCKFLLRQLHPSNCLGIRSFAGKFLLNLETIFYLNYEYKQNKLMFKSKTVFHSRFYYTLCTLCLITSE